MVPKPNHFGKYCKSDKHTKEDSKQINKVADKKDFNVSDSESNQSSGDEYVYMSSVKEDKVTADVWLNIEGRRIKFQIEAQV